ncbi:hypothetical protein PILCRDRAFT_16989 [Piloderma croceum F 1598]|uniref:Uncharacterized protein n=1 Tax=Piloderma croceum (strain F 1598) TaxID=765440 RepID=A0A0C3EUN0_PILCF|nr:hypothetical protein PILCRDRAFT_16989 [Piloderma croceum F 1598]
MVGVNRSSMTGQSQVLVASTVAGVNQSNVTGQLQVLAASTMARVAQSSVTGQLQALAILARASRIVSRKLIPSNDDEWDRPRPRVTLKVRDPQTGHFINNVKVPHGKEWRLKPEDFTQLPFKRYSDFKEETFEEIKEAIEEEDNEEFFDAQESLEDERL